MDNDNNYNKQLFIVSEEYIVTTIYNNISSCLSGFLSYATKTYINREAQIFSSFFLSLCVSHEKFAHSVRKVVSFRFAESRYNLHQGFALEAFKVSMLILWENFN
jgi:hypothetical protein